MLSKKLLVIMIMATLLISTLVTEGLAAVSGRKDDEAAKKGNVYFLCHGETAWYFCKIPRYVKYKKKENH